MELISFISMSFMDHTNIKCQNGPVLPPAQVFYFNGQALTCNKHNIVKNTLLSALHLCEAGAGR
jgi:hypothetical protein